MSILADIDIKQLCTVPDLIEVKEVVKVTDRRKVPGAYRTYKREPTEAEKAAFKPMIHPFVNGMVRSFCNGITKPMGQNPDGSLNMVTVPGATRNVVSYGLDSQGYDVRLRDDVRVFSNVHTGVIDPKRFDEKHLHPAKVHTDDDGGRFVIIPPNSYAMGYAVETFNMPDNVTGVVIGKTTYARCSIIVNPTKLQPGYRGDLVLEFSNSCSSPARLYIDEGAASIIFFRGSTIPALVYHQLGGLYQGQQGVQLPTIEAISNAAISK